MSLRVVLADDNYLVREGVAGLLEDTDGIELLAAVGDLESLLEAVDRLQPDAVLTDIRMPPTFTTEGIDAAKRIRARHPATGVVVLSSFAEEDWGLALIADGAEGLGYLLKDRVAEIDEVAYALRTVARGGSVMDPRVIEGLRARRPAPRAVPLPQLNDRERAVLQEMAGGHSNGAIARRLYLSERSVEKHISSTFLKLGLNEEGQINRRVAAVLAYLDAELGLRDPGLRDPGPARARLVRA